MNEQNNTDKFSWWSKSPLYLPNGWIAMIVFFFAAWGLQNVLDSWMGSRDYWMKDEIGTGGWLGIIGFLIAVGVGVKLAGGFDKKKK